MGFLPSCGGVSIKVWMHHLDSTETFQKKNLYGNSIRMPLAVLNRSWKKDPTKQQLYDHLQPILQIIHDEQDILGTASEVSTISYGLQYIDMPSLVHQ